MESTTPKILWTPDHRLKEASNLKRYIKWLATHKHLDFEDYDELWTWSVEHTKDFWESITQYFNVIDHGNKLNIHSDDPMPHTRWFEGSRVNYAEHIFRNETNHYPAIIFKQEGGEVEEMSWPELREKVTALQQFFIERGVSKGDRIVAYIPNIPEATVGFLAACSIGAIWSSCSPDFGSSGVVDRFQQIEPCLFITVDGYKYGGKSHDRTDVVQEIISMLPTINTVIEIPYLNGVKFIDQAYEWKDVTGKPDKPLEFVPVDFSDPIWVLYSSGTTGQPKAITHSQGGVLLEHLKYVSFHNDVKPGERYFWYTTTGWMMWNFVQATLLVGATIVLYDGSPGHPHISELWEFAEHVQINHFGTSAPFILACMNKGIVPKEDYSFKALRSISSTGSPLPSEAFDWIYESVKSDVWLCSMSGGTDVCSAFVGGCPLVPLYEGEIQRRALGCAMYSFDDSGNPLIGEVGEMVVTKPMPSMPVFFWNDPDKSRYLDSYFEMYPGIWRHGDWLEITGRNTLIIKGRSDATLNRHGIRIGTAEIYQCVDKLAAIKDSLVLNLELSGGQHFMPLFVMMNEGAELNDEVKNEVSSQIKKEFTARHIPDEIIQVDDIPYTISGKKMEAPVKKILMGRSKEQSANIGAMRNPTSLDFFVEYARIKNFSS